ncbi:DNA-processing protein DprA [bacterium]|nr:DNA-processing protein DprA [bacterium]
MLKYWVALSSLEKLNSEFILKLYSHFKDIEKAFYATKHELEQIEGLSIKKAEHFLNLRDKVNLEETLDYVLRNDIEVLPYDSENYPKLLKEISNPPAALYVKGDLASCNLNRTIAIVGSRKASFNGKESLSLVLKSLVNTDICIVSGLASGIDTTAHHCAIENNLKTIGVIASGFDFVYPESNRALYQSIIKGNGAIITEYYPTFEPLKYRFPERNRIVTGLSYGTIVVEAALKSGALISANLTLEQGRELMCIPGLITNPNTKGIYNLIKNGATIITEGEDILNALNWEIKPNFEQQTLNFDLNDDEKNILKSIEIEPKEFDDIQFETKINTDDLLMSLTTLELKGIIKQVEGYRYQKVQL